MWNENNEYNSPNAMISRGLNPFIGSNIGAGVSRSTAGSGAVVKNYWIDSASSNQAWIYTGAKRYCEVIAFDKFLTIEQLKQVQSYIKQKYNV